MAGAQCVLVTALFFGLAHSWDFAVSAGDRIEFYTNEGKKIDTIRFLSQNVSALAYDEAHNMLLYVDKQSDGDAICGYNMTSVEYKCFVQRNGRNIQGLAFDPITELLFFTDTTERSVCTFSFKSGSKNIDFGTFILLMDEGIPTDIAVDHCRGYIYWINSKLMTSTIERARFDGSDREVVINATNSDLHSLAIDQKANKMYWIEPVTSSASLIYSADLDGKNQISLVQYENVAQGIDFLAHPNTISVSKNQFFLVGWCSNCKANNLWKFGTQEDYSESVTRIPSESALGITANYKMKDQFEGFADCIQVPNNYEIDDSKIARDSYEGPYCLHGTKVDGQSICKCAPGYIGVRCEVSICENYCLEGNCSLTEEGLPECRCEAGYYGKRCEINACFQHCLNNGTCT